MMNHRFRTPSLLVLGLLLAGCEDESKDSPPVAARKWAAAMNIPVDGVQCAGTDSDGDGYVSCDLAVRGDKAQVLSIQCASRFSFTSGCKSTQPKVVVRP